MKQQYLHDIFSFANTAFGKVVAVVVAIVMVLSLSSIALAVDGAVQNMVNQAADGTSATGDGDEANGEASEDAEDAADAADDESAESAASAEGVADSEAGEGDEAGEQGDGTEGASDDAIIQTTEEAIQAAIVQQAPQANDPVGAVDQVSVTFSATNCTFNLNGQNISEGIQTLPQGKDLTFTITPDSGYVVSYVEIQTGGPIPSTLEPDANGVYTVEAALVTSLLQVSASAEEDEGNSGTDPQPSTVCEDTVVVDPGTYDAPVITLNDITRTYIAVPQPVYSADLDYSVAGLQDGDELVISDFTGAGTDAGTYELQVTKCWIKRVTVAPEGTPDECAHNYGERDVTAEYKDIDLSQVRATLTIEKADLYIVTPSETKYYDGTPLTYEGDDFFSYELDSLINTPRFYEYRGASMLYELINYAGAPYELTVTGARTEIGTAINTASITPSSVERELARNYNIHTSFGRLTVLPPEGEIALVAPSDSKFYDGRALSVSANDIIANGLPEGFRVSAGLTGATRTDAGKSTVNIDKSSVKILNQDGKDVTELYDFTVVPGEIAIEPAGISVVTFSASKASDGRALTAGGEWAGLVNGETATFTVTGSQTGVGSSQNTYTITWNGTAKQSNYRILSEDLGTLTVTAAARGGGNGGNGSNGGNGGGTGAGIVPASTVAAPATDASTEATEGDEDEGEEGINETVEAVATGLQNAERMLRGEEPTDLIAPAVEESLGDDETPLGVFDAPIDCWVHWYSILGLLATAVYGGVVMFFRRAYAYELETREANILGVPVGMAQPQIPAGTSGHAGREA